MAAAAAKDADADASVVVSVTEAKGVPYPAFAYFSVGDLQCASPVRVEGVEETKHALALVAMGLLASKCSTVDDPITRMRSMPASVVDSLGYFFSVSHLRPDPNHWRLQLKLVPLRMPSADQCYELAMIAAALFGGNFLVIYSSCDPDKVVPCVRHVVAAGEVVYGSGEPHDTRAASPRCDRAFEACISPLPDGSPFVVRCPPIASAAAVASPPAAVPESGADTSPAA